MSLVTTDLVEKVVDWKVHEVSISDHRLITIDLRDGPVGRGGDNLLREGSYNIRKVDWKKFDLALTNNLQSVNLIDTSLQEHASRLTDLIIHTMETNFPKAKKNDKKAYWWTEELAGMRSIMRSKHRLEKNRIGRQPKIFCACAKRLGSVQLH